VRAKKNIVHHCRILPSAPVKRSGIGEVTGLLLLSAVGALPSGVFQARVEGDDRGRHR
jgi:hypothetical protein